MPTSHISASKGEIAKIVLMPGDPMRAKYIAENFLDSYQLVNSVRCAYAYTGTYKGKNLTVMASGMGMPSMGIYSYELFKFYDVDNIIRIGSCGGYSTDLKMFDIILSKNVFSESNISLTFNNEVCHQVASDELLNNAIINTANSMGINLITGNTVCTDFFDEYMTDQNQFFSRIPSDFNPIAAEMEAFALFYVAKSLNKKAACLTNVVDLNFSDSHASSEEREVGLNNMIKLALESCLNINY